MSLDNFNSYKELRKELFELLSVMKYINSDATVKQKLEATISRGNIIILGTLLESYVENIVLEHCDEITKLVNTKQIHIKNLSQSMQEFISKSIIHKHYKKEFENMHYGESFKFVNKFVNSLPKDGFIIDDELDGINKFSFGKHGETELKKVFKRVGISLENIIEYFDDLNNFFELRNGLIHSDSLSLTQQPSQNLIKTREYILKLYSFGKQIDSILLKELGNIKAENI